jgi:membrane protein YdbS with pleckstrin-like domain
MTASVGTLLRSHAVGILDWVWSMIGGESWPSAAVLFLTVVALVISVIAIPLNFAFAVD